MKIKIFLFLLILLKQNLFSIYVYAKESFTFDVTEIEILENGNIVKGTKKGKVKSDDGIIISSETFLFNRKLNEIKSFGNVKVKDLTKNIDIFSDELVYKKNEELIFTNKNSKATYDNKIIFADSFNYNVKENTLSAFGNVVFEDKFQDFNLKSEKIIHYRNREQIITTGNTESTIQSKYNVTSKNVEYNIIDNTLRSENTTTIKDDKSNVYKIEKFNYLVSKKILKAHEVLLITQHGKPKSDNFYFSEGIFDFNNQEFVAKETTINIHNNVFGNSRNNPRLRGVSSSGDTTKTTVNKAIFTSCNKESDCPSWSIKAEKIEHDKEKKQLVYNNAVLNFFDVPIFYFPKFFHPDPSVERQTGFLIPELNNSNILGSSIKIPYFKIISENKDLTFRPVLFDSDMFMPQVEYRQENQHSSFSTDLAFVNNYVSKTTNKKKNLSHFFAKYDLDLNYENFIRSDIDVSIQRVSNDTYLKVFDTYLTKSKLLRPQNFDTLKNSVKIFLEHEKYSLETGFEAYEKLKPNENDRYQYIFPYYDFNTSVYNEKIKGSIDFNSNGANDIKNTNQKETNIINNIDYTSEDYFLNYGIKTNYNINIKNLNSIGENSSKYKSSPQTELVSLFNANLSLPLIKETGRYNNFLTPKMSLRFNPSDMKDYSSSTNQVNVDNIFSLNRLGLSDTLESGRSLTIGVDYKKEIKDALNSVNQYFELKLATVFRDKRENFISEKSTLNNKNSNLFGAINGKISENIEFNYNFSLDNDYSTFESNQINTTFKINKFITNFSFLEQNNELGDTNVFKSSLSYKHDDKNFFTFNTRRNRRLNLTEYYDLVYEYRNDCLTAGIKYKKTYYSDRDLKPSENLLFTVTLIPLSTHEYDAKSLLGD